MLKSHSKFFSSNLFLTMFFLLTLLSTSSVTLAVMTSPVQFSGLDAVFDNGKGKLLLTSLQDQQLHLEQVSADFVIENQILTFTFQDKKYTLPVVGALFNQWPRGKFSGISMTIEADKYSATIDNMQVGDEKNHLLIENLVLTCPRLPSPATAETSQWQNMLESCLQGPSDFRWSKNAFINSGLDAPLSSLSPMMLEIYSDEKMISTEFYDGQFSTEQNAFTLSVDGRGFFSQDARLEGSNHFIPQNSEVEFKMQSITYGPFHTGNSFLSWIASMASSSKIRSDGDSLFIKVDK